MALSPVRSRLLVGGAAVVAMVSVAAPAGAAPQHPATTHLSVSAIGVSPTTVAHSGGTVHFKATVHHATHCKVTSSHSVSGLPATKTCTSGHVAITVHVGADPSAAARHITFTLTATKGSHHQTKTVTLTQAAAPVPSVTHLAVSPTHVASAGGTVHVTATVAHASTCTLSSTPALSGLPSSVACTGSTYSHAVALPSDTSSAAHSYLFTVKATGPGGSTTATTHPMATVAGVSGPAPVTSVSSSGAPLPAGAYTGSMVNADLTAVTCPSAGHCVAVGYYYSPPTANEIVNRSGLIETLSGTTWTASQAPVPTDIYSGEPSVSLNAVSCSSSTDCAAVGDYIATNQGQEPYVATLSGTTWTWQPASVPYYPGGTLRIGGDLNAVSCVTGGCVAVGNAYESPDIDDAMIETPGVGGWSGSLAPLPANADPEESNGFEIQDTLVALSCTTSTNCTAVGGYTTGTGSSVTTAPLGETLTASGWTPSAIPPMAGGGPETAVSCAGSDCAGTGSFDAASVETAEIQTEVNGSWSAADAIAAPLPTSSTGGGLNAVDCAASTSCTFVGEATVGAGSVGWIDTGSGTSYTETTAPLPTNAVASNVPNLYAVSCPAVGSCGVVGVYRGSDAGSGDYDSLLETESTSAGVSTWTPSEVPTPTDGTPGNLISISCVAGWGCASVGVYLPNSGGATGELVTAPL